MDFVLFVIIIIILIFLLRPINKCSGMEGMGTSPGTIIQLYAKDPQDTYLIGNAWKYVYPWFTYDYGRPTYLNYNYRRRALFKPTRTGMLNYYYYRPYGLYRY